MPRGAALSGIEPSGNPDRIAPVKNVHNLPRGRSPRINNLAEPQRFEPEPS